ncbi:MAG TPA: hypothetical protein VMY77_14215 [Chitinophagaceae bacterium]|nr:hypothetical protein [Chitinophagaceae bacterium]
MQRFLIFFPVLFLSLQLYSQDTLPKITVSNINDHILVSWTNPYITLTTINIQRSFDSTRNFTTIGSVLDVNNKRNGFIDSKPLSLTMYYRIFLSFEGGTYLFTKSSRPVKDTSKALPDFKEFQQSTVNTWFVPSKLVYTGRDNNVIIALPDAGKKKYSIKFFEENGAFIFELNKITEPYLTLEKVNFMHSGIFDFEIFENGVMIEKHKVYVPKDGKPVPNANELGKPVK